MIVKAKKYGNSRVITIPTALWEFFEFNDSTNFSMESQNGEFVIRVRPNVEKALKKIDEQYGEVFQSLFDK